MKSHRHRLPSVAAAAVALATTTTLHPRRGSEGFEFRSKRHHPTISCRTQTPQPLPPPWRSVLSSAFSVSSGITRLDASSHSSLPGRRTGSTAADVYFRHHGRIPQPKQKHVTLPARSQDNNRSGILIVGDVHGCLDELLWLHHTAMHTLNKGRAFEHVLLVGDLVNKGPQSAAVVRHVRTTPRWRSVRGNHDDAALAAALGDEVRRAKATYRWIFLDNDNPQDNEDFYASSTLSDDDVEWMAALPCTITIPKDWFGNDNEMMEHDVLIVHAGLVPGIPLTDQSVDAMVNLRTVVDESTNTGQHNRGFWKPSDDPGSGTPWANVWKGPQHVVFGHDAKRGLQQPRYATGLDTGACYGKRLTGLVLPQHELVSVPALAEHCPVVGKKNKEGEDDKKPQ